MLEALLQAQEGPLQQLGGPAGAPARFRGRLGGPFCQQHLLRGAEGRPADQQQQRPASALPGLPGGRAVHRQHRGAPGVPGPGRGPAGGPALQQPRPLRPPGGPPPLDQVHQPGQPEAALQQHRRPAPDGGHGREPAVLRHPAQPPELPQRAEPGLLAALRQAAATAGGPAKPPGEPGAGLLLPAAQRLRLPFPKPPHLGPEEAGPERQQPVRQPPPAPAGPADRGRLHLAPPGHHGVPPDGHPPQPAPAGPLPLLPPALPGRLRQPHLGQRGEEPAPQDGGPLGPAAGHLPLPRGLLRGRPALAPHLLQPAQRFRGRGEVLPGQQRTPADAAQRQPGRRHLDHEPLSPQQPRLFQFIAPSPLGPPYSSPPKCGIKPPFFFLSCG